MLRQIRRSLAQRQADYAAGKGSLLGEKELEAWRAYRRKLELSPELEQYFEESEKALERAKVMEQRRQRRFIVGVLLVAAIAVVAALISYGYSQKAQRSERGRSTGQEAAGVS